VPDPLLLLDVDGVLCPLGSAGGEELVRGEAGFSTVQYSTRTADRLQLLTRHFIPVWATGWQRKANESICPLLGLPPLPWIEFDLDAPLGETWKLPSIMRYVRKRPFAWIDDEIGPDAHRWAKQRAAPTLLLDIRPDCGLSEDDVETLIGFAESIPASSLRSS
jgi:Swiss Army Knife RNA repair-like protein